ncbi:MAG: excinuclease ABC subunit UvrC [Clostridiales bacterium]|nr:excinuclease ABC subunit UvrC [Clostridiales bacterium]
MNDKIKTLRTKAMKLPLCPGVYIMKNSKKEIIYIGKAKKLKNRVSQYFGSQNNHPAKVRKMVENVDDFEYILCDSEFEALVLEASLIKQNQPKYNILLKDDKGYSYIRVSQPPYRKISAVLQKTNDKATYIGPFTSFYTVRQSVDEANRIFKLPQCNKSFPADFGKGRPCLNYHIDRCMGLCRGKVSPEEYEETVSDALSFLNGDISRVIRNLTDKMNEASEAMQFERAAAYRDKIKAIKAMQAKQKVINGDMVSKDVFAFAASENKICAAVLRFDKGRLNDSEYFFLDAESDSALRSDFLLQYYGARDSVPAKVLLDADCEDRELLNRFLSEKRGRKAEIVIPQKGEGLKLVNMCLENAFEKMAQKNGRQGRELRALEDLRKLLGLEENPDYIESYDISHTAGADNVAGMIVFRNGRPYKKGYRKFQIKSFSGQDDYGSMKEVLKRRFTEYKNSEDKTADDGFGRLPDLILLDGGIGQVNAVKEVMKEMSIDLPVFGMVKDSKHRTRAISSDGGEIAINSNRAVFTLVSQIQDEVHRFSVTYHHKKHTKSGLSSSLMQIDGIGQTKAQILFRHFKTIKAIKEASVDELANIKGINKTDAQRIYDFYRSEEA